MKGPGQTSSIPTLSRGVWCQHTKVFTLFTQCAAGSGELIPLVNELNPMEINTDGGGTVFQGQSRKDRMIVEIMDPYRKTKGTNSIAEMGVDIGEDGTLHEVISPYYPLGIE